MIVAGFGFRSDTGLSSLQAALALAQQGHGAATALAAPQDKAPALAALAEALGLPVIEIPPQALAAASTLTRSAASLAACGTGSVAEAAALAAAGLGARLLGPRHVSPDRRATCAIATSAPAQGNLE